jgi:hypothetical protein
VNESITLTFSQSVTADKQAAIAAAFQAELDARLTPMTVIPAHGTIKNNEFEIDYNASYHYESLDAHYSGSDSTTINLQGKAQDATDTIGRFFALRGDWISKAYRVAVRSIANVASDIQSGVYTPPPGTEVLVYLVSYINAINAAFPNNTGTPH